jgi:hypothetical protein
MFPCLIFPDWTCLIVNVLSSVVTGTGDAQWRRSLKGRRPLPGSWVQSLWYCCKTILGHIEVENRMFISKVEQMKGRKDKTQLRNECRCIQVQWVRGLGVWFKFSLRSEHLPHLIIFVLALFYQLGPEISRWVHFFNVRSHDICLSIPLNKEWVLPKTPLRKVSYPEINVFLRNNFCDKTSNFIKCFVSSINVF